MSIDILFPEKVARRMKHFSIITTFDQPYKSTYNRSGLKWWIIAQNAIPFLQDVVRLVTLTPE